MICKKSPGVLRVFSLAPFAVKNFLPQGIPKTKKPKQQDPKLAIPKLFSPQFVNVFHGGAKAGFS